MTHSDLIKAMRKIVGAMQSSADRKLATAYIKHAETTIADLEMDNFKLSGDSAKLDAIMAADLSTGIPDRKRIAYGRYNYYGERLSGGQSDLGRIAKAVRSRKQKISFPVDEFDPFNL